MISQQTQHEELVHCELLLFHLFNFSLFSIFGRESSHIISKQQQQLVECPSGLRRSRIFEGASSRAAAAAAAAAEGDTHCVCLHTLL